MITYKEKTKAKMVIIGRHENGDTKVKIHDSGKAVKLAEAVALFSDYLTVMGYEYEEIIVK